jgi:hypothetical protein
MPNKVRQPTGDDAARQERTMRPPVTEEMAHAFPNAAFDLVVLAASAGDVMAQDPSTAWASPMPGSVVASGAADLVLPLEGIASALVALVMVPGAVGMLGPPRRAA